MKHFFLTLALASSALHICCSASEPTINLKELKKLNEDMHNTYFKKTDYSKDSYFSSAYWQRHHVSSGTNEIKTASLWQAFTTCKAHIPNTYRAECASKAIRTNINGILSEYFTVSVSQGSQDNNNPLFKFMNNYKDYLIKKSKTYEHYCDLQKQSSDVEKDAINLVFTKCQKEDPNSWESRKCQKEEFNKHLAEITKEN